MSNKKIHKLFPTPIFETKVDNYEKLNLDLKNIFTSLEKRIRAFKTIKCWWWMAFTIF